MINKRVCVDCGSKKTDYIKKRNYYHWYKKDNGFQCKRCYSKKFFQKNYVSTNVSSFSTNVYTDGVTEEIKPLILKIKKKVLDRFVNDSDYRKKILFGGE